jgi:hypothetical protein
MQRTLATRIVVGLVSAGAACMVAMAGCGNDAAPSAEFIGVWKYDQSAAPASCTVAGAQSLNLLGAHKELRDGAISDLVEVGCDYRFDIRDKVATLQANQTCDLGGGDTETMVSSTLTLTSATTMEEVTMATDNLFSGGFGVCTLQITGHLVRISKD